MGARVDNSHVQIPPHNKCRVLTNYHIKQLHPLQTRSVSLVLVLRLSRVPCLCFFALLPVFVRRLGAAHHASGNEYHPRAVHDDIAKQALPQRARRPFVDRLQTCTLKNAVRDCLISGRRESRGRLTRIAIVACGISHRRSLSSRYGCASGVAVPRGAVSAWRWGVT